MGAPRERERRIGRGAPRAKVSPTPDEQPPPPAPFSLPHVTGGGDRARGTEKKTITVKAYPGEKFVITGCEPITAWALHEAAENIQKASTSWALAQDHNQVLADGQVMIETRFPSESAPSLDPHVTDPTSTQQYPVQAGADRLLAPTARPEAVRTAMDPKESCLRLPTESGAKCCHDAWRP